MASNKSISDLALAFAFLLGLGRDSLIEGRGLDCSRADGVTPDLFADKIDGNGFGQADHCGGW